MTVDVVSVVVRIEGSWLLSRGDRDGRRLVAAACREQQHPSLGVSLVIFVTHVTLCERSISCSPKGCRVAFGHGYGSDYLDSIWGEEEGVEVWIGWAGWPEGGGVVVGGQVGPGGFFVFCPGDVAVDEGRVVVWGPVGA